MDNSDVQVVLSIIVVVVNIETIGINVKDDICRGAILRSRSGSESVEKGIKIPPHKTSSPHHEYKKDYEYSLSLPSGPPRTNNTDTCCAGCAMRDAHCPALLLRLSPGHRILGCV
jgi:hypothetical protein